MQTKHDDGLLYFQFDGLPNSQINHAIYSRQGGFSSGPFDSLNLSVAVPDDHDRVYANRRKVYGRYGRNTKTVVHAHLVHGADVARVTQQQNGTWVRHVDGLITNEPGCVLAMNYADCAPILLIDPVRHAVGLGHGGWRGTVADVAGAMVRQMTADFGSDPAGLLAAVGPSIHACCYEVGDEVVDGVERAFDDPASLLRPKMNGGKAHFDLPEANRRQLAAAGVNHIEMSEYCTACRTDLFFSHRAEKGRTGRFAAVLALADNQ